MKELLVATIILVFSFFYILKHISLSKKRNRDSHDNFYRYWTKHHNYLKWGSVLLCFIATLFFLSEVLSVAQLQGKYLAQADFGLFLTFMFYIFPTIILVILALFFHFKYEFFSSKKPIMERVSPFLICAILIIMIPLVLLLFFT